VLARVTQAHDNWDRSLEAAAEARDEQVDENLREYNEARQLLEAEAASLPHSEVRSRLRELGDAYAFGFSDAHLELFARLMKSESYYHGHPLRTAWWLLRYSSPKTLERRWKEVRTGNVYFAG
jgi:hypothetical protein